jgi:CHAT domain-containing protein
LRFAICLTVTLLFSSLSLSGQETLLPCTLATPDLEGVPSDDEKLEVIVSLLATIEQGAKDSIRGAELFYQRATLYAQRGNFDLGLEAIDRAVSLLEDNSDPCARIALGRAYYRKGSILEDLDANTESAFYTDLSISVLGHTDLKEEPLAIKELSKALMIRSIIAEENIDPLLASMVLDRLKAIPAEKRDVFANTFLPMYEAYVANALGEVDNALRFYQEFLRQNPSLKNNSSYGFTIGQIGFLQFQQGDIPQAMDNLGTALQFFKKRCDQESPSNYDYQQVFNRYADLIRVTAIQGDCVKVKRLYAEAIQYLKPPLGEYPSGVLANFFSEMATAKSRAGDTLSALEFFDRSLKYLVEDAATFGPAGLPLLSHNVIHGKIDLQNWLLRKSEHFARQEDLTQQRLALVVHNKLDSLLYFTGQEASLTSPKFTNDPEIRRHYEQILNLLSNLAMTAETPAPYWEMAFRVIAATKGNAIRRKLDGERIARAAGLPSRAIDQRQAYSRKLTMLRYDLAAAPLNDHQDLLDSLLAVSAEQNRFDRTLAEQYPRFKRALERPALPPVSALPDIIGDDQMLIDFFVGEKVVHAVSFTPTETLRYHALPLPDNLPQLIEQHLEDPAAAETLFRALLDPILDGLPSTVTRIQIIPDDKLWDIIFPALRLPSGEYLVEQYALSLAYSWQSLYWTSKKAEDVPLTFAGFGADYAFMNQEPSLALNRNATLSTLPMAPNEVKRAARVFGGQSWINERATKKAFRDHYQEYGILHLALHGLLDEADPFNSSVLFPAREDQPNVLEPLLLSEVLELPDFNCHLLALSTCYSNEGGLEPGEGINSLARGFRLAGARAILASRWEVNDQVSHDLLANFYAKVKDGLSLDRAMQRATIAYLNEQSGPLRQPFYWGNFSLIGAQVAPLGQSPKHISLRTVALLSALGIVLSVLVYRITYANR